MNVTTMQRTENLRIYNIAETAKLIGKSYHHLYQAIQRKEVIPPSIVIGKRRYYSKDDLPRVAIQIDTR